MRKFIITALAALVSLAAFAAAKPKICSVSSPDGQINVKVTIADDIRYDVVSHGETLMAGNKVAMKLRNCTLGEKPVLKSSKVTKVSETVTPDFKLKFAEVENNYSLLTLSFKGGYKILWRVYDDGLAYRFSTAIPGEIEVMEEVAEFNLASVNSVTGQITEDFETACEEPYSTVKVAGLENQLWEMPLLAAYDNQKILFSEFDLEDYPGLFVRSAGKGVLTAAHPHSPLSFDDTVDDRWVKFLETSDWIAKTSGTRDFPWRYMLITQEDGRLAENRMPMRLAPEARIDFSWVNRGQTTWDWLNGIPYGPGVDFVGGINLQTYKYFTDFAAKNGVKYILIDEGWALNTENPYVTNPQVNLPELISYADSKGIGVILWLPWLTVEKNMDKMFETFENWGIKGTKIDFMNRQDQWMVDYYERVAAEAAKHHIFVDFHGAFHPSGLEYRYPNVLTFEGVRGLEFCANCQPDNSIYHPYLRNAVGPMDFTPGMMVCCQPERYKGGRPETPAVGTKAAQLAQIVAFETGLQMLADNPCRYDVYPDCRDFMCGVPVDWDDTKVLAGEFGAYYVVAKRSGDTWYIAGLNNSTARNLTVDLSCLAPGKTWKMISFSDGYKADSIAMDYRCNSSTLESGSKLEIHMARNGGYAARLEISE
ncbi:MAG: glycoside hydrolase family 97 protein [Bacteroidales bacterium]|nr:glycoside hydrolase family 97 protein [Bacteroidales bacterium]